MDKTLLLVLGFLVGLSAGCFWMGYATAHIKVYLHCQSNEPVDIWYSGENFQCWKLGDVSPFYRTR